MDYESFYNEYLSVEKEIKDSAAKVFKLQKSIARAMEKGDVKSAKKDMQLLKAAIEKAYSDSLALSFSIDSFDNAEFYSSGEFASGLLSEFRRLGINAVGESPVYEIFPCKVRLDIDNQDVYLNRKKYPTSRPSYFASLVKGELDKFDSAFNADRFAAELEKGYDTYIALQKNGVEGMPVQLKSIYNTLVPISRLRNSYTEQSFAYDIARLYAVSDSIELKSRKRIEFGTDMDASKGYRILDANGNEQFIGTVRFF